MTFKTVTDGQMKNADSVSPEEISAQMRERRPLPMGKQEFMAWTDRIIAGALVPADVRSQRFVLADMLLHLGPQEDHKEDAFFIHGLRKVVVNQVAFSMREEIKKERDAEAAAEAATAVTPVGG